MRHLCRVLAIAGLIGAAAGCGGEEAAPAGTGGGAEEFVAKVDEVCRMTADAAQVGPRFPYRTFDPTNPDRRQRAVGRFYTRLDTEGSLDQLRERLRALQPPADQRAAFERMLADLDAL